MTTPAEPRTEAGRALLLDLDRIVQPLMVSRATEAFCRDILAIEAEAARSADEARQRVVDAVGAFLDARNDRAGSRRMLDTIDTMARAFDALAALDTEAGT